MVKVVLLNGMFLLIILEHECHFGIYDKRKSYENYNSEVLGYAVPQVWRACEYTHLRPRV